MDTAADPPTLSAFLVEHYWPGVTPAAFAAAEERVFASAAELGREGQHIRYLHATLVPEEESAYCVLAATSRELVEQAHARAGVPFERVVEAVESQAAAGRDGSG